MIELKSPGYAIFHVTNVTKLLTRIRVRLEYMFFNVVMITRLSVGINRTSKNNTVRVSISQIYCNVHFICTAEISE